MKNIHKFQKIVGYNPIPNKHRNTCMNTHVHIHTYNIGINIAVKMYDYREHLPSLF